MRQLLIFLLMLILSLGIDLQPIHLSDLQTDRIRVTIRGAVKNPGLYELPLYASISDALAVCPIESEADVSSLNPQMILKDKDVLMIPSQRPEDAAQTVSINTGDEEQLSSLPGIGPSTAQKIIQYRQAHGLFQSMEQLLQVPGIGPAKFAMLKDRISL